MSSYKLDSTEIVNLFWKYVKIAKQIQAPLGLLDKFLYIKDL